MVLLSLRDGHTKGIRPWDGPRTLWGAEPWVSTVPTSVSLFFAPVAPAGGHSPGTS